MGSCRNVELKARCPDLEALRRRVEAIGARPAGELRQRDTFFASPAGRLKLRETGDGTGELIAYRRPDLAAGRVSEYDIHRTGDPDGLRGVLAAALGVIGVVAKRRRLYLHGRTRIHLDEVAGLGSFVELETVVVGSEADARAELERLVAALEVPPGSLVGEAYVDLLGRGEPEK